MTSQHSRRRFLKMGCAGLSVWLMPTSIAFPGWEGGQELELTDPGALEDFAFVHLSDTHVSPFFKMPTNFAPLRSYEAVRTLLNLGSVRTSPEAQPTLAPDFAIHTGDIAEYGFPGVTQEVVDKFFEGMPFPIYWIMGNHDNTWVTNTRRFRELYGDVSYTFDHKGVRFIGLNSATFQEPLPSFGEETVLFLREVLRQTPRTTPIVLFFHHPFSGDYFVSEYEKDRIRDELRHHNVLVTLLGHYHSAQQNNLDDHLAGCIATATFSKGEENNDGYSVVDFQEGTMRILNVHAWDHERVETLMERRVDAAVAYPSVAIAAPAFRSTVSGNKLEVKASCDAPDATSQEILLNGGEVEESADLTDAPNGSHYLKVRYHRADDATAERSTCFELNRPHAASPMTKWSRELHAAAIPSPLYHDGSVYIGTNLGTFHCLDAETGEEKWRRQLKAEILRKASVYQDSVLVGSGDGVVTCFGLDGDKRFEISAQHAVYCPLVVEGDQLYYGNVEAELVCYNLAKNEVVWRNSEAEYSVEAQPVPTEDRVYFSAWDGYFYCLGKATGETLWKTAAPKNRERVDAGSAVSRYYGPADTPPIPLGDRVLLCDRGYEAATYDLDGNYIKPFASDVAAMNYDAGTERVVVRHIKEPAAAYSLEGEKLWTSDVTLGRLPIQPTLTSGNVLATTNDGYLHALDLATGKTNWSYRVTPQLYVLGAIETNPAGTIAFAAGMNGVVKAIDLNSIQNIYKV